MPQTADKKHIYDPREAEQSWWECSHEYAAGHHFAHQAVRSRIAEVLHSLGCNEHSDILDLGCGAGEDAVFIRNISQRITGVDLSAKPLQSFVSQGFGGLLADVRLLPFKPAVFDFTVCFGLLHHLVGQGDLTGYVQEFIRVTRPGGYVIAMEPNVFNPSGLMMNIFNTLKPGITGLVPHERALSPLSLLSLFKRSGLNDVRIEAASFVWNRLPLPVSKFIYAHEHRIRSRMPFGLFGWFEVIRGRRP